MGPSVLICLDSDSQCHPELAGLGDESVCNQDWCVCLPTAAECRAAWRRNPSLREAWFVSCDDMDPINAAAAVKRDDPSRKVFLVSSDRSGSSASRAKAACLDGVWGSPEFLERYASAKRGLSACQGVAPWGTGDIRPVQARVQLPAKGGSVIAVVSASGGSGKSTVSALLAMCASRMGIRTALLDADMQFGDVHHLLGSVPHVRLDALCAAASFPDALSAAFPRSRADSAELAVVSAPAHVEDSEALVARLPEALDAMRAEFELTVVNTGAFWCETHALLLERADRTVFLIDQRPSSLRACVHALDLCSRMGVSSQPFVFAINRCDRSGLLSSVDASCALRGAHVSELPDGGRDVDELLGAGYPQELLSSRNPFMEAFREFADGLIRDVLPDAVPEKPERKGRGLFRKRKGGR